MTLCRNYIPMKLDTAVKEPLRIKIFLCLTTDKFFSSIPYQKKTIISFTLIQFHDVPFILAPKLVIWIRDDGEEHGGGSLSTWHQDPLGAHHCIANITIFIWWANNSPSPHRLLFSNWIVVFFRERLGVLSDQKQLLDERRWSPFSAFK